MSTGARNEIENIKFETLSFSTKSFDLIECQPSDRHVTTTKYRSIDHMYQLSRQNNYEIPKITIIINKDLEDKYEHKRLISFLVEYLLIRLLLFVQPKSEILTVLSEIILIQNMQVSIDVVGDLTFQNCPFSLYITVNV